MIPVANIDSFIFDFEYTKYLTSISNKELRKEYGSLTTTDKAKYSAPIRKVFSHVEDLILTEAAQRFMKQKD